MFKTHVGACDIQFPGRGIIEGSAQMCSFNPAATRLHKNLHRLWTVSDYLTLKLYVIVPFCMIGASLLLSYLVFSAASFASLRRFSSSVVDPLMPGVASVTLPEISTRITVCNYDKYQGGVNA